MNVQEIDLREFIAILRRQTRLIALTLALFAGVAIVYLLVATPIYQATSLIRIETNGSDLLDSNGSENQQSAVLNSVIDSEVEILRSNATAMALIVQANLVQDDEFGPQLGLREKIGIALGLDLSRNGLRQSIGLEIGPDPTQDSLLNATLRGVQNAIDIRRLGQTYVIAVSVSSRNPDQAALLSNAAAAVYIDRQVQSKTDATIAARDVLSRQLETARLTVAQSEDTFNLFIEENLSRLEAESGDTNIAQLREELEQARSERLATLGNADIVETAARNGDWSAMPADLGDAALTALALQRQDLVGRLGTVAEGSAQQVDLRNALAQVDIDLSSQSQQAIENLRTQVGDLAQRENAAKDQLRQALLGTDLSSDLLNTLFSLQQNATVARDQYQQILSRVQDFGALANIQIADARVVSQALPPYDPASPNSKLILVLALVAGLGAGIGLALMNEYYIGGVTSGNQLRNILPVRVPVTIPAMSAAGDPLPLANQIISAPLAPFAETFRKLRSAVDTSLQRLQNASAKPSNRRGKVVLICSALPGEGKSTAALALARTYAAGGRETLLIDVDLRKPMLGNYLGVTNETGLLDYLQTMAENASVQPVPDPLSPLMAITAGARSTDPTDQLLNGGRFRALIDAARDSYEIIVLDAPPLLPLVDTRYLTQYADVILQLVRFSTTTQGEVREAHQQLTETKRPEVEILAILSQERSSRAKGGYHNGQYASVYGQTD